MKSKVAEIVVAKGEHYHLKLELFCAEHDNALRFVFLDS